MDFGSSLASELLIRAAVLKSRNSMQKGTQYFPEDIPHPPLHREKTSAAYGSLYEATQLPAAPHSKVYPGTLMGSNAAYDRNVVHSGPVNFTQGFPELRLGTLTMPSIRYK